MLNINTNITQGGRVVVNGALDKEDLVHRKTVDLKSGTPFKKLYDNSSTDDIYMHIVPGEPLFMYKKRASVGGSKRRKTIRDTDVVVFSSLNGIIAKKQQSTKDFEDDLSFMGFADIQTVFNADGYTREDCVTQVGGLRTTVNTGGSAIRAGDMVYWALPSPNNIKSHSKIVAELLPVRKHQLFSEKTIEKRLIQEAKWREAKADENVDLLALTDMFGLVETAEDKATLLSKMYRDCFIGEYAKFRSKVIGTAMSNAKPGQEIDILIGSYSI